MSFFFLISVSLLATSRDSSILQNLMTGSSNFPNPELMDPLLFLLCCRRSSNLKFCYFNEFTRFCCFTSSPCILSITCSFSWRTSTCYGLPTGLFFWFLSIIMSSISTILFSNFSTYPNLIPNSLMNPSLSIFLIGTLVSNCTFLLMLLNLLSISCRSSWNFFCRQLILSIYSSFSSFMLLTSYFNSRLISFKLLFYVTWLLNFSFQIEHSRWEFSYKVL